jgi:hypothetical protein
VETNERSSSGNQKLLDLTQLASVNTQDQVLKIVQNEHMVVLSQHIKKLFVTLVENGFQNPNPQSESGNKSYQYHGHCIHLYPMPVGEFLPCVPTRRTNS